MRKSVSDFLVLSNHIAYKHGGTLLAQSFKLDRELFIGRLRGDHTRMMIKSIKMFEGYLNRVGKEPQMWDEEFLQGFLKIANGRIVDRLK